MFKRIIPCLLVAVISFCFVSCKARQNVSPSEATSTTENTTSNASEPASNQEVHSFKAKVKEASGNYYVVEKLNSKQIKYNGETTGALYRFDYGSAKFKVGDIVVVEYKYPIAETYPALIVNLVNVYLAK